MMITRMLSPSLAAMLLLSADVTGQSTDGDKNALVAFKASTSSSDREDPIFISWAGPGAEMCDDASWNSRHEGWMRVMCDGPQGRVVYLNLYDVGAGGDLNKLAPLTELRVLSLQPSSTVSGSLNSFAGMTQLRYLDVHGTAVHGPLSSLFELAHLGEPWVAPDGVPYDQGRLYLADTNVYGPVEPLRLALPALADWGPSRDPFDYTPCSRIGYPQLNTCSGLGVPMVADASEVAGMDECACCAGGTSWRRDNATGTCIHGHPAQPVEPDQESESNRRPAAEPSPAVESGQTVLAGLLGLGALALVCGIVCCRRQERDGLFERLLAKVTKGDAKYDTSEVKLSAPGVARSDMAAAP